MDYMYNTSLHPAMSREIQNQQNQNLVVAILTTKF